VATKTFEIVLAVQLTIPDNESMDEEIAYLERRLLYFITNGYRDGLSSIEIEGEVDQIVFSGEKVVETIKGIM
jgi:hypothetical protein